MPQVVMPQMRDAYFLSGRAHGFFRFIHAQHALRSFFHSARVAHCCEHLAQFGNYRHAPNLVIFGPGQRVAANDDFAALKIDICPGDKFCFGFSEAGIGKERNEICAVLGLRSAGAANRFDEL